MIAILLLFLLRLCPSTIAQSRLSSGFPTIASSSLVADSCFKTNESYPPNSQDWSLLKLDSTSLLTSLRFTGIQSLVDVLVGDDFSSTADLNSFQLCAQYSPAQDGTNVSCLNPVVGSVMAIRAKDVNSSVRLCAVDAFGFTGNILGDEQEASLAQALSNTNLVSRVLDGDAQTCVTLTGQVLITLELQLPVSALTTFWVRIVRPIDLDEIVPGCGFDSLQVRVVTSKTTSANAGWRCLLQRQMWNATILDYKCSCGASCTGMLHISKIATSSASSSRICEVNALAILESWSAWSAWTNCDLQRSPVQRNRTRSRTCLGSCQAASTTQYQNCTEYPCTVGAPANVLNVSTAGTIRSNPVDSSLSYYLANMNCSWSISVPGGQIVEINVSVLDTQPLKDQLFVHDGSNSSSPLVLRLSGNQAARTYVMSGARAFIRFETDGSDQRRGFSIAFRAILRNKSNCLESNNWFYTGRESLTVTGRTCQNFSSNTPQIHTYHNLTQFPDGNAGHGSNFCRNFIKPSYNVTWCYTTGATSWEDCDIPICNDASVVGIDCVRTDTWFYAGNISKTKTGATCQRWDTNTPHPVNVKYQNLNSFVDGVNGFHSSYCRNPADSIDAPRPWCYTMDPAVRWEYCQLPPCNANGGNPSFDPPLFPCTSGVLVYNASVHLEGVIRSHPTDFYPSQYLPNMNCSWTLDVTFGKLLLTISDFNLTTPDALRIYNGSDTSSPLIASLTGDLGSSTLQLNGTRAFLQFTSDSVNEASGFSLSFKRS